MAQPWLHDLVLCLAAPTQVWTPPDGQLHPGGFAGAYHDDRRVLSELVLLVDGAEPAPVAAYDDGGDARVLVAVPRALGDPGPDPTVRVVRRREVEPGLVRERYAVSSTARETVRCELAVRVASDLAPLDTTRAGDAAPPPAAPTGVGGPTLTWHTDTGVRTVLRLPHAETRAVTSAGGDAVLATWSLELAPGETTTRELLLTVEDARSAVVAPPRADAWDLAVTSEDRRLGPVVERALADLRLLRLALPGGEDAFLGAGAPWFLTLFGRDSLWAARMLVPVSTELAGSTLRVLASRQGTKVDRATAEEPGKVLHEVRSTPIQLGSDPAGVDRHLPEVYYGTIDATPLWALTLADAAAWGLPAEQVEPLLPALEAALTWQVEHGDADGDHLLEYVDHTGHGLSNQGWKDSGDAVRRSDGAVASAPIALSEVQGYAYAAAVRGADLLEAYGVAGTDRWREWAATLRERFRSRFWVEDARGAFPAIALDGDKRPVVSLTSNTGHLLGTGLLDPHEVAAVAERLAAPDMLSGWGVRTMSRDAAGYSPTGYHVGSVWPHDTAICLLGLAAEGRPETAPVGEALLRTLHAYDGRPPELFAGDAAADHPVPLPYPAACRPQAWSAAAAVALVTALAGLRAPQDGATAPSSSPVEPWTWGRTTVAGLRAGGAAYRLEVDATGEGRVTAE